MSVRVPGVCACANMRVQVHSRAWVTRFIAAGRRGGGGVGGVGLVESLVGVA